MNGKTNHGIYKKVLLVFVMTVLCALFAVSASALETTGQCGENVYWTFNEAEGELIISGKGQMYDYSYEDVSPFSRDNTITSVTIEEGVFNIPETAFRNCEGIVSISLPDTLQSIGSFAFSGCKALKKIVIPENVSNIGSETFAGCTNLASVTILSPTIRLTYDFLGCLNIREIHLPDAAIFISASEFKGTAFYNDPNNWDNGVLYIGKHLIKADDSITGSYTVKPGTLSIASSAFCCENLESIIIPETVEICGSLSCPNLNDIQLPNRTKVIYIEKQALSNTKYYKDSSNWKNGALYIGEHLIEAGDSISGDYIVADGTITISDNAFNDELNISSVRIPDSVLAIGDSAFAWCQNIKTVNIGSGVTEIGKDAFSFCRNIEKFIVDEQNNYFCSDEYGALYDKNQSVLLHYPNNNRIKKYILPETIKHINDCALRENTFVEEVVLNDGLEVIGNEAFCDCFRLRNIVFPDSLLEIGDAAFGHIFFDSDIVLPKNLRYIGECALLAVSLDTMTVKGMDTQFGEYSNNFTEFTISGISTDKFVELLIQDDDSLGEYMVFYDDIIPIGTIRCHAGSTAEAYAKENGIDCELIHFFSDWVYDWDNLVRSHECDICGFTETEPLEKTENGGVEIVEPVDPDTEFIVEEITKNGDKYAVVEKTLGENLEGDYSILKTFDITLKNKDGVHVQPDGTVKVKLPLDWDKEGDYKVYRVNDDGTLTDMEAYREGSHMVFDTDHFSIYVIVDESPEQPEEPAETEENDSPFGFLTEIIRMFKELLNKIITFFRSIGDLT